MRNLKIVVFSILLGLSFSNIHIVSPHALRSSIKKKVHKSGEIPYSLSTFGIFDYQAKGDYILKLYSDSLGCNPPKKEIIEKEEASNVAFIMNRGGCKYFNKAQNIHIVGGRLGIVILDNNDDPSSIIPVIGDIQGEDNASLPPIMIIDKVTGDLIYNYLQQNPNLDGVKIYVNFQLVKYCLTIAKILDSPSEYQHLD